MIMYNNYIKQRTQQMKKITIKVQRPKQRNPIARIMCETNYYKNKVVPNKKKIVKKFDIRKEMY